MQYGNAVDGGSRGGFVQQGATTLNFYDTNSLTAAEFVDGTVRMIVSGHYMV